MRKIIRGKDVKESRVGHTCDCIYKKYSLDILRDDLYHFLVLRKTPGEEKEHPMRAHKHDTHQEYWYIFQGKGKLQLGDEVHDVEEGDLIITPPGVEHKIWTEENEKEDLRFVCVMAKYNSRGKRVGTKFSQYKGIDY